MAKHVCPVWMGWWLASPIRKLFQDPEKILRPYLHEGMTVLEPGCAMGFFTLPAARLVGPSGKVICIDLQPGMIAGLKKRALKADLGRRIEARLCSPDSLGVDDLPGVADFAFAIAVAHEVPDQEKFFRQVYQTLKPGSRLLFAEPRGEVSAAEFEQSVRVAENTGFQMLENGSGFGGCFAVLKK